jgi:ATP-dependent DNA helicase RecQ
MARFLAGLNSPATTRAKLKSHAAFGALADVPFATVLAALKQ